MTREEELWSMTAKTLQMIGLKLGLNITNSDIKKGKAAIINKILSVEELKMECPEIDEEELHEIAQASEVIEQTEEKIEEKPKRKRGTKIEYNGKSQNICAWAKELNVSANTLYSRIYILGWSIEKAFTYKK